VTNGKQRTENHVIEDISIKILEKQFPNEWVIRRYTPDYGIDISVELFEPYKDNYITTGEHIYFQVKGTKNLKIGKLKVFERYNVEKGYKIGSQFKTIEVVKFVIETSLLATVERMGSAVPVLLAIVDINTENTYFICLNDYIEKVIIPENPNYKEQECITLNLPKNNILNCDFGLASIKWYAKRAKLFSLFNKISYQNSELDYIENEILQERIQHFLRILRRYDAWSASYYFGAMQVVKEEVDYFVANGITIDAKKVIESYEKKGEDVQTEIWETSYSNKLVSFAEAQKMIGIRTLWDKLNLMGQVFEDVSKEWLLPTSLSIETSQLSGN